MKTGGNKTAISYLINKSNAFIRQHLDLTRAGIQRGLNVHSFRLSGTVLSLIIFDSDDLQLFDNSNCSRLLNSPDQLSLNRLTPAIFVSSLCWIVPCVSLLYVVTDNWKRGRSGIRGRDVVVKTPGLWTIRSRIQFPPVSLTPDRHEPGFGIHVWLIRNVKTFGLRFGYFTVVKNKGLREYAAFH